MSNIMRSEKASDCFFYIGIILFCLGCANLFSTQGYFLLIASFFFGLSLLFNWKICVSKTTVLVALFGFSYAVFSSIFSADFSFLLFCKRLVYAFLMPVLITLVLSRDGFDFPKVFFLFASGALGLAIQGILLFVSSYFYLGSDFAGSSLMSFFENGPIARTGLQLMVFPAVSISFAFFLNIKKCRDSKAFLALCLFFFVYDLFVLVSGITVQNRAIYVAAVLQLIFFLVVVILRKANPKVRAVIISTIAVLSLIVIGLIFGILPLPDFLTQIPLFDRFLNGGSNSLRIKLYVGFFENFWKKPFGGLNNILATIDSPYVHNFILDLYTYGGIIPFVLFVLMLSCFVRDMAKISKRNYQIWPFILMMASGIFFLGMFEPLFQANGVYFILVSALFSEANVLYSQPKNNISLSKRINID